MITAEQIKAGRKLLGWSQMKLGLEAGLAQTTIVSLERGKKRPSVLSVSMIKHALEAAGVIFVAENGEGLGVRLKKERGAAPDTIPLDKRNASNDE
jgi:DNA-binding XRE family transcriptional regulator